MARTARKARVFSFNETRFPAFWWNKMVPAAREEARTPGLERYESFAEHYELIGAALWLNARTGLEA